MTDSMSFPLHVSADDFTSAVERFAVALRRAVDPSGLKVFIRPDFRMLARSMRDVLVAASGGHTIVIEGWDKIIGIDDSSNDKTDIIEKMGRAFVAVETAGATDLDGKPITWDNTGPIRREHLRSCMCAVLLSIWPNWNGCPEVNESAAAAAARAKVAEILE